MLAASVCHIVTLPFFRASVLELMSVVIVSLPYNHIVVQLRVADVRLVIETVAYNHIDADAAAAVVFKLE